MILTTYSAWDVLEAGVGRVEAVVAGCEVAEQDEGYTTTGYGGSPDEQGETTLDAMVMDGYVLEKITLVA